MTRGVILHANGGDYFARLVEVEECEWTGEVIVYPLREGPYLGDAGLIARSRAIDAFRGPERNDMTYREGAVNLLKMAEQYKRLNDATEAAQRSGKHEVAEHVAAEVAIWRERQEKK